MNGKVTIARINGVDVVATMKDGEAYVPVKSICDAIGIASEPQRIKINEDEFFSSTATIIVVVASDGKEREMFCLPLKYVYGWLATINPGKVAPETREKVAKYRRECYEVLYNYFTKESQKLREQNEIEKSILDAKHKALEDIENYKAEIAKARASLTKCDESLAKLQEERINPEPTLFD